jgi:pyruvate/2-oxoglutarate dehydrogenase complex dihydrolipoamide dehydrogenase (E3) component
MVINCLSRRPNIGFAEKLNLSVMNKGKIKGGLNGFLEQTVCPNIFAAGDCLADTPRNEPAASISGKRVARFIKATKENDQKSIEKLKNFSFQNMPYCLFAHPEISGIGLNEESCKFQYEENEVKILTLKKSSYTSKLSKMGLTSERGKELQNNVFKLLVEKESDKIIGMHYLGEKAAEVIQGYAVRFLLNLGGICEWFDFD